MAPKWYNYEVFVCHDPVERYEIFKFELVHSRGWRIYGTACGIT